MIPKGGLTAHDHAKGEGAGGGYVPLPAQSMEAFARFAQRNSHKDISWHFFPSS